MKLESYQDFVGVTREISVPRRVRQTVPACVALVIFLAFVFHSFGSYGGTAVNAAKNIHFPRKIWQIWRIDSLGFEEPALFRARTWVGKNTDYRYEVLTDANDVAYVEANFGAEGFNRLDIVHMYRSLTARIIKADLLRYLVMYAEGGVYADIDVELLRPLPRFIPERYDEKDIDMLVGVEIDEPAWIDHPILGSKCQSFCQWTFMCKPRLPVMLKLVEHIMDWINKVAAEQRCEIADIKLDFDQVISGTGPSAFTKAILEDISERTGRKVGWEPFHDLVESKLVGGVLVLPVEAFAAGQGHSDSGNHDTKHSLVKHHYHASHWPDRHPRYKHPILGEVEECNWKPECVHKWDEDKAAFDKLSEKEKKKRIAAHEKKVAEEKAEEERKEKEEEAKRKKEEEEAEAEKEKEMGEVIKDGIKKGIEKGKENAKEDSRKSEDERKEDSRKKEDEKKEETRKEEAERKEDIRKGEDHRKQEELREEEKSREKEASGKDGAKEQLSEEEIRRKKEEARLKSSWWH